MPPSERSASSHPHPERSPSGLESENARLLDSLADLQAQVETLSDQYARAADSNARLETLHVALQRLHESFELKDLGLALEEIVSGLIGCEEMVVFEVVEGESRLRPLCSAGLDPDRLRALQEGRGIVAHSVARGERFLGEGDRASPQPEEENLSACLPLRAAGRAIGAVALIRLLPQKSGYEPRDFELFDLLEDHGGRALYAARLHALRSI